MDISHGAIEKLFSELLRSLDIKRVKTVTGKPRGQLSIYDKDDLDYLLENDELSSWEVGFMQGYLEGI